jgi:hypothetical protein
LIEPNKTCSAETLTQTKIHQTNLGTTNKKRGKSWEMRNKQAIKHSQEKNSNVLKNGQDKAKRCTKY